MPRGLQALVALALVVGALATGYRVGLTPVTLVVDGQARPLRTHQDTVALLLMDVGLTLHPEDAVTPPPNAPLRPGMVVEVQVARPVYVSADGQTCLLRTHATSVEAVLQEARVSLGPYDEVEVEGPLLGAQGSQGSTVSAGVLSQRYPAAGVAERVHITVRRAIPFTLWDAPGTGAESLGWDAPGTGAGSLGEGDAPGTGAGSLGEGDAPGTGAESLGWDAPGTGAGSLGEGDAPGTGAGSLGEGDAPGTGAGSLGEGEARAITLYTTAATVGEALRRAGLTLYLADGVRPGLGERLQAGAHVYVSRSAPATVQVDGRTLRTRTHRQRVGEVLADLNIVLMGEDYTVPPLDAPLGQDATVQVVRVSERFLVEQEPIPFDSTWQPDPELEIDSDPRVLQEGSPGIFERRIRVRYEDGHEVAREVDSEHVAVAPTTKIMGYGTKIVIRTLDTPGGPIEYWRVIRALATSYSASTAGTPKTSPWYGRTATGMVMRHGIVAVDPRYIPLRTQVYVPGYGVGIAGDTGSAIKGRRIDLGYDDSNLVLWYRWVDVYLLTPVPSRISYVLD